MNRQSNRCYAIRCVDAPGRAALRDSLAQAHRDYVMPHFPAMLLGGPLLDERGRRCGSLIVIRLEDDAAARAFIEAEPYCRAGLFAEVSIDRFEAVTGDAATDAATGEMR